MEKIDRLRIISIIACVHACVCVCLRVIAYVCVCLFVCTRMRFDPTTWLEQKSLFVPYAKPEGLERILSFSEQVLR